MFLKATGGLGFPGGSVVKNTLANAGDTRLIPGWGRSPGEGIGNLLQYSCLENPMDRGAWQATVYGVAKSRTQLRDSATTTKGKGSRELLIGGGWRGISSYIRTGIL